jgi:hypothetical protein
MQKLIADIRAAAHKERAISREATELQLYALQLCTEVEKQLNKKRWYDIFIDPEPMKDESHSIARYVCMYEQV